VEVSGLPKFMTFDNKTMKLTINYGQTTQARTYYLTFTLTDGFGKSQDTNLMVVVQEPIKVEIPVVEEIVVEEEILLTPNVSAKIESISTVGLMKIEFNASMQTGFNLSLFNSSVMDLYIEPAYERHEEMGFRMETVNFTWKVVSF